MELGTSRDAPTAPLTPPDALIAKLKWPSPRWVEITPEIDRKLNLLIDKSMSCRHATIDALRPSTHSSSRIALPKASTRSDAVH